jgi:hypothetical protein
MAVVKIRNANDDGWIEIGGGVQIIQQDSAPGSTNPGMLWLDTDEEVGVGPVITEAMALYIATDGNDTTGDGSIGLPWLTLDHALAWLQNYRILPGVTVTVNLAAGRYDHAARVELLHLDGDRISIRGLEPEVLTTSSIISYTGSVGSWYVTMATADTGDLAVGDLVGISAAIGGTRPTYVQGGFEVTAVVANTSFTVYSNHRDTLTASGNVIASVAVFRSVLNFANYGLRANGEARGCTLYYLGVMGDYDSVSGYGLHALNGAVMVVSTCVFLSFTYGWLTASGAGIHVGSLCYFGVKEGGLMYGATNCATGTSITLNYCYIVACQIGSYSPGGSVNALYAKITGCVYGTYSAYQGSHYMSSSIITGCASIGIYATAHGFNHCPTCTLSTNNTDYSPALDTPGNEGAYNNE